MLERESLVDGYDFDESEKIRMVSLRVLAIVLLTSVSSLQAATVISNSNLSWVPWPFFKATIFQDTIILDETSVWFDFQATQVAPFTFTATLRGVNVNLDEGSDWYVVNPGDVFSAENIANGLFTPLITVFSSPTLHPAVELGNAFSDIYLGVNTGRGSNGRNVFGWVHLRPNNITGSASLDMLANVVSYDSQGIIVGTTTAVPEPSSLALIGMGIGVLLRRRALR